MLRIAFTLEIERPAAEVFDYLTDLQRLHEWQTSAVESHADGPLRRGARITERRRLLGHEGAQELEVTAFEPPRRLTLRSLSGPVRFTVDHELDGDGKRTALRFTAERPPRRPGTGRPPRPPQGRAGVPRRLRAAQGDPRGS